MAAMKPFATGEVSRLVDYSPRPLMAWQVDRPKWTTLTYPPISELYRGASLIRNNPSLGPYSRLMLRVLVGGGGLMSEVPLYIAMLAGLGRVRRIADFATLKGLERVVNHFQARRFKFPGAHGICEKAVAASILAAMKPLVLNLRTTTSQKCEAVPRSARL